MTNKVRNMPRKKKEAATVLVVVADESGSMYTQTDQVINGFNEYIEELRKNEQNVLVTLVKFNTRTDVVFENTPIVDVPRLDRNSYVPSGGTALYDGVANAINAGEKNLDKDGKAILVIFTDGGENSSVENSQEQVFKKITTKQNDGNWTIVFLGADQDAWAVSRGLGIAAGNTMSYAGHSHAHMISNVAKATLTRTASPAASSVAFFADAGQSKEDYENPTPPAGTGG